MGALVDLLRDARQRQRRADDLAHGVREYVPSPPYERPAYAKMNPDAQALVQLLAKQMVDREAADSEGGNTKQQAPKRYRYRRRAPRRSLPARQASLNPNVALLQPAGAYRERRVLELAARQTDGIEALQELMREGFERLAEIEEAGDKRERFLVRLTAISVAFGALGSIAAVLAIFL
jgi:hypothetical protein